MDDAWFVPLSDLLDVNDIAQCQMIFSSGVWAWSRRVAFSLITAVRPNHKSVQRLHQRGHLLPEFTAVLLQLLPGDSEAALVFGRLGLGALPLDPRLT